MNNSYHETVLKSEAINYLKINPKEFYIDCTLGEGGHSYEIYKKLSPSGRLLSLDHDINAIEYCRKKYSVDKKNNWKVIHANFTNIDKVVSDLNRRPAGILMDLGLSSRQLEIEGRGISYQNEDDPIDMRMDQTLEVKAIDLLRALNRSELAKLFRKYGEERYAKSIAKNIKQNLEQLDTVKDLNLLISRAVPTAHADKHPSRRVFQALRIAVNDELNSLEKGLDSSLKLLESKGRIIVISFHSLEDRIVKHTFLEAQNEGGFKIITDKPQTPSEEEIESNPRARSAKMRVIEKL
jgi:16S rRNA (cytosine1402-N4)-methyltransferase